MVVVPDICDSCVVFFRIFFTYYWPISYHSNSLLFQSYVIVNYSLYENLPVQITLVSLSWLDPDR